MSVKERLSILTRGIKADIGRCGALIPHLETQQRLLAAVDNDGLAGVARAITGILGELDDSARERAASLRGLGLEPDAEGVRKLLGKLPEALASELEGLWHKLETDLARCKALNERNGELLTCQRSIISELTGRQATGYGDFG